MRTSVAAPLRHRIDLRYSSNRRTPLDKQRVITAVRLELESALAEAERGAERARREATHSESKAENKYDTRGLEASYLAVGVSRRVLDLRRAIAGLDLGSEAGIGLGSLIRFADGRWYFLALAAGGVRVTVDGETVTVLTPESPLGQELMGLEEGDGVEVGGREIGIAVVG